MKVSGSFNSFIPANQRASKQIPYLQRQISSTTCRIFFSSSSKLPLSKKLTERATILAAFHKQKGKSTKAAREIFGKYLINNALNLETASTKGKPVSSSALHKAKDKVKAAAQMSDLETPRISKKKKNELCFSASMHCIKRYLKLKELQPENSKAFFEATNIYTNGIPEKIAILQSIENNIKHDSLFKKTNVKREKRDHLQAKNNFFASMCKFKMGSPLLMPKKEFFEHL